MKVTLISIALLFCSQVTFAQDQLKIIYEKSYNGKTVEKDNPVILYTNQNSALFGNQKTIQQAQAYPYELTYIDRTQNHILRTASLTAERQILQVDSFAIGKQQFNITNEKKKILGYTCTKAVTSINSNTIELWFTTEAGFKGAPTELGQDLGLVLEQVRNGNSGLTAVELNPNSEPIKLPVRHAAVDELSYKDLLWKSRFTQIPIFQNEQINFGQLLPSDSVLRFAEGTVILKKVKIPKIKAGSSLFIDLVEKSLGDAYDRTGSIFLIPMDKKESFLDGLQHGINHLPIYENGNGHSYQGMIQTDSYSPALELMRFFTPFGVSQFNHIQLKDKHWADSVQYRQEITEFSSMLSDQEVYIGTYIGNYDRGGHRVSVNLTIHPGFSEKENPMFVQSIFNSTNLLEMAGQAYPTMFNQEQGLTVKFKLDEDVKHAQLRYITTGHGGWGNGDEFLPKANRIFLDGQLLHNFTPWRSDCGSYRLLNPASGNFANGLSSSDLSRSNWCPGMVTYPIFIDIGDLQAGEHEFRIQIPQGEPEGTSFSYWNVSGALLYQK